MPKLLNPEMTKTKTQPGVLPNVRTITSCIKYRETTPSIMPVHEHQPTIMTSYQSGAPRVVRARSCRAVSIYGAFGKKISQRNAMNATAIYSQLRLQEIMWAK